MVDGSLVRECRYLLAEHVGVGREGGGVGVGLGLGVGLGVPSNDPFRPPGQSLRGGKGWAMALGCMRDG